MELIEKDSERRIEEIIYHLIGNKNRGKSYLLSKLMENNFLNEKK